MSGFSRPSKNNESRRRSLFARTPLSALTSISDSGDKKSTGSSLTKLQKQRNSAVPDATSRESLQEPNSDTRYKETPQRPRLSSRESTGRPSSIFGSLRSLRTWDDFDEPLTATSSKPSSLTGFSEPDPGSRWSKTVLHHGEVQTSSSMFRKKREYVVLTETHIVRLKTQQKAAELFSGIPAPGRNQPSRHSNSPSIGSIQDHQSHPSEGSEEGDTRAPLKHVVAIHLVEDGRPYFGVEIALIDDNNYSQAILLQLGSPDERDLWLQRLRNASNRARLLESNPISQRSSEFAARIVEREGDYEPPNYAIYKVLQKPAGKLSLRSSLEDVSKESTPSTCFLAIGAHKVHIIPVPKHINRSASPILGSYNSQDSFGILNITCLRLSDVDDSFDITFRLPLQRPRTFHLASLASHDIAVRLRQVDDYLRPEWETRPYTYIIPEDVKQDILAIPLAGPLDQDTFDRTLVAYCLAYGVSPGNIQYQLSYPNQASPRFELLNPVEVKRPYYNLHELLAVMRALRYNETFSGISFAGVKLDVLNGQFDHFGNEHVCMKSKRGSPVGLSHHELTNANLLVQEIRALAISSKKLRYMDFTGSISKRTVVHHTDDQEYDDPGCGIAEALFPLCRTQSTNVDWIIMNKIPLSDADLDYIVSGAVERDCHLRALEVSGCGLNDRSVSLLLESFRAQEDTLETIDISSNPARLSPTTFGPRLRIFGFIRRLVLANVSVASGTEPLLTAEVMMTWRLEELNLGGTNVNTQTVEELACYLASPRSQTLHDLRLDRSNINGKDIAVLMRSMSKRSESARQLHLDISRNRMESDHVFLSRAIAEGYAPSHLTIKMMDYADESLFRDLINAFAFNRTIKFLDMSQATLPSDASEETCQAMEKMLAENNTLEVLDISGENSRLSTSKLGVGINRALCGLKRNRSLRVLFVQNQKLGMQGAATLADVLKVNTTLRELHCEHNSIMLSGFTDLINALHRNTTLLYLPDMTESYETALHETQQTVKSIRHEQSQQQQQQRQFRETRAASGVRRLLSSTTAQIAKRQSLLIPSSSSSTALNTTAIPDTAPSESPQSPSKSPPARTDTTTTTATTASSLSIPLTLSPSTKPRHPSPLSDADIRAAMSLVNETWTRQRYRLSQYLTRNLNIANGIPTTMDVDEEDFERPDTASSLGRLVERVKFESTPTMEKELNFVIFEEDASATASPPIAGGDGTTTAALATNENGTEATAGKRDVTSSATPATGPLSPLSPASFRTPPSSPGPPVPPKDTPKASASSDSKGK